MLVDHPYTSVNSIVRIADFRLYAIDEKLALLFGLTSAIQTQVQFSGTVDIPHQFIGMIPYVMTILVLAGFVGRTRVPAADGVPYEKE